MHQFALNLIKRQTTPRSVKQNRFKAALDAHIRAKVISGLG